MITGTSSINRSRWRSDAGWPQVGLQRVMINRVDSDYQVLRHMERHERLHHKTNDNVEWIKNWHGSSN